MCVCVFIHICIYMCVCKFICIYICTHYTFCKSHMQLFHNSARLHICDMMHSYVWVWIISHSFIYDAFICVTWLIHMCYMTHSYVWHDAFTMLWCVSQSFTCVTWHIHVCDMTPSHVWHDIFIRATWLIHACGMIHSLCYGVATISRLLKIIGLFCRISSLL